MREVPTGNWELYEGIAYFLPGDYAAGLEALLPPEYHAMIDSILAMEPGHMMTLSPNWYVHNKQKAGENGFMILNLLEGGMTPAEVAEHGAKAKARAYVLFCPEPWNEEVSALAADRHGFI